MEGPRIITVVCSRQTLDSGTLGKVTSWMLTSLICRMKNAELMWLLWPPCLEISARTPEHPEHFLVYKGAKDWD